MDHYDHQISQHKARELHMEQIMESKPVYDGCELCHFPTKDGAELCEECENEERKHENPALIVAFCIIAGITIFIGLMMLSAARHF